jgi:hypothetical protein
VFCQTGCYSKTANIRVRPVHEMEVCLVFTPDRPRLFSLNPTAWLIFELCDGRRLEDIERAYYDIVEPLVSRNAARQEVGLALAELQQNGIVERLCGEAG